MNTGSPWFWTAEEPLPRLAGVVRYIRYKRYLPGQRRSGDAGCSARVRYNGSAAGELLLAAVALVSATDRAAATPVTCAVALVADVAGAGR